MRTPIYLLMAALLLGGCTHYHATPAGSPSVDRVSEPERPEPLELDVGRPSGNQLLIQTSRPAYVAIFEIIPNRSVTLIYPAAVHQQNMLVSGLTWVPLWWSRRAVFNSDRYIYAVASEEPLSLSGETFTSGYFSRVFGLPIYRAERPYTTMRAISNAVVPNVADEEWAEDVLVLSPTWHTEVYRTARIYCAGGRYFDVPEDMVSRVWCPTRTRVVIVDGRPRSREYPVGRPARPDSVFGQGGTRVRLEPRRPRGPIVRVVDPTDKDRDDRGRGRVRDARDDRDDRDKDEKREPKGRSRISDVFKAKKEEQEREKAEREREKEERERQRREAKEEREEQRDERKDARDERKDERKDARDERKDERREERDDRKDERKDERREERDERRDEPKQQGQPREEKREEKRDEKQEEKQEEKRAEPREEKREEKKGRARISDMIKEAKEKEKEKEKQNKP